MPWKVQQSSTTAGKQGRVHIFEYFATWRLYVGLTVHEMGVNLRFELRACCKYHYHQGLPRTVMPVQRASAVISNSLMTITNTERTVRGKAGKVQGWSGPPEREGWAVKLGYCSPHPFCTSAPSCLLLFLHKLSHSAGSWLQGWPAVQGSFLPSTMNKSSGSGGIVRLGKAGRWVNQRPHPRFSGAADIRAGLQAQGLCSCVMYTGIQVPLRAYQGGYPVPITFSLPVKMTLHPEGSSGDPLSASPITSSTAVWQYSLFLTGELPSQVPLWASSLSFSTLSTFRSHLLSYLRG